jgi:tetratricopeptide (TPR) repeat protein
MRTWSILFAIAIVMTYSTLALSQGTVARFSLEDIIERHRNDVPCRPLTTSIAERGIRFEATPDVIERLKREQMCDLAITEVQRRSTEWVRTRQLEKDLAEAKIRDLLRQGNLYLDAGEYAQAIAEVEKARTLNPNHKDVLTALDAARTAQKTEAALSPGPLSLAAMQRLLAGKVTQKRVARLVEQRNIGFTTFSANDQAQLRSAGANDEVIVAIKAKLPTVVAVAQCPPDIVRLVNTGKVLLGKNNEEALRIAEHALNISRGCKDGWELKGDALRALQRFADALVSYDKALEIDIAAPLIWAKKGMALNDLSRHQEAVQSLDKALDIDPSMQTTWVFRGDTLLALKRCDDARGSYDKALEINSKLQLTLMPRYEMLKKCGQ